MSGSTRAWAAEESVVDPENQAPPRRLAYTVQGGNTGGWPRVLESLGLMPAADGDVHAAYSGDAAAWRKRVEAGTILLLEAASPLALDFGFQPAEANAEIRSVADVHDPEISIIWERAETLPRFDLPSRASVFARERWNGAPLVAGYRLGRGAVLWTATDIGPHGHEKFPYLPQALTDLGFEPPFRSRRLWLFFDSSYRSRVDLDYFAVRWRKAGVAALHVAAWHFWEPDAERDAYLRALIEACHRQAILVYAWLEFPHVSQRFWDDHPAWREKTAAGQDAHLDWRRLMNLQDPDAQLAVAEELQALAARFDWDGVNLAELYFESLEGAANPARFTPMNDIIRREFEAQHGFDPATLWDDVNSQRLRTFLDWRAGVAAEMQRRWLNEIEKIRETKPWLDLVLTHVDDRFDTRMRDLIGADAARALPLLEEYDFQFLVEDPATIWHLGPERYAEIARRYEGLNPRPQKLGIDINIVERYQDVYPTKLQTGVEAFQLVHEAAKAFPRVALYFESSIRKADLPLLPAAAAVARQAAASEDGSLTVELPWPAGVAWSGPALVNGEPWPAQDDLAVWLPAGSHTIARAPASPGARVLDFSGDIITARLKNNGVELAYRSDTRAIVVLDRKPAAVEIDGANTEIEWQPSASRWRGVLPRGQHLADFHFE